MSTTDAVCNYALLHFIPYPETGERVNVGVLVSCQQPCLIDFQMETKMPDRVKTLFPDQNETVFEAAARAMEQEMLRVKGGIRDPKSCQIAFNEVVRPRESTLRFSEPKTMLTADAHKLAEELFSRYVRMTARPPREPQLVAA